MKEEDRRLGAKRREGVLVGSGAEAGAFPLHAVQGLGDGKKEGEHESAGQP